MSETFDAEGVEEVFRVRMRMVRQAKGLRQEDVAAGMRPYGVTLHPSAVAKMEAGDRSISLGEAIAIAFALEQDFMAMIRIPRHIESGEVEKAKRDYENLREKALKHEQALEQAIHDSQEIRNELLAKQRRWEILSSLYEAQKKRRR